MCAACWSNNRRSCENIEYTGLPTELRIGLEAEPVTSLSRVTRSMLDREGWNFAKSAAIGTVVCVETHNAEETFPWVLADVKNQVETALGDSPEYNDMVDDIRLHPFKQGHVVLKVQLYEALEPGSSTYTLSDRTVLVAAARVRVVDVVLDELRTGNARRKRFVIDPDSLLRIRAAMPTCDDSWEVEAVVQYRTCYSKEQWLVKWKGYGEHRNTWEPLENLLTDEVKREAAEVKQRYLVAKAAAATAAAALAAARPSRARSAQLRPD